MTYPMNLFCKFTFFCWNIWDINTEKTSARDGMKHAIKPGKPPRGVRAMISPV